MHNPGFFPPPEALRHRRTDPLPCQKAAEKLEPGKKPPSKSVAESFVQKNICGNQRKARGV